MINGDVIGGGRGEVEPVNHIGSAEHFPEDGETTVLSVEVRRVVRQIKKEL